MKKKKRPCSSHSISLSSFDEYPVSGMQDLGITMIRCKKCGWVTKQNEEVKSIIVPDRERKLELVAFALGVVLAVEILVLFAIF